METLVPRQLVCPLPHVRAGLTVGMLNPTARGTKRSAPSFQKHPRPHTYENTPRRHSVPKTPVPVSPALSAAAPDRPPPHPTLREPCGTPHGKALPPAPQRAGSSPAALGRSHSPMSELQNASCGWMGTQVHASATRSRRLQLHRNTARKPSHAVMLPAPGCASSCSRCSVRLTRASPARSSLAPFSHRLTLGLGSAALARRHGANPSAQRCTTERG